ncbi:MAG: hypothetical protein AB7J13_13500 [Pyrinomonadaceae bacterium]
MQPTRKESLEHIISAGEQNVRICIENELHVGCTSLDCPMDLMYADLDDNQIDGSVNLLSRLVHCNFDRGSLVQIFHHLVGEQIKRHELSAEILEAREESA